MELDYSLPEMVAEFFLRPVCYHLLFNATVQEAEELRSLVFY